MASSKRKSDKIRLSSSKKSTTDPPPKPFKPAPEALQTHFTKHLDTSHVYVAHIDKKPKELKRKVFLVPVAMNLAVSALFLWRAQHIVPYYYKLGQSALGHVNETTFDPAVHTWGEIGWELFARAASMLLDLVLFIFVWPWPVEFCAGRTHGNPVRWRASVGFREEEIYIRRSREWDRDLDALVHRPEMKSTFLGVLRAATAPSLIREKTGYLTMNGQWDLDWALMVKATQLVDKKDLPLDAFRCVVLFHDKTHGWLSLDMLGGENAVAEERRRQVFAFRDALVALDKEQLFFRWIEIVQFESTRPGGFGPDKQVEVAAKIREMFAKENVDFDELWKESVGADGIVGM